MMVRPDLVLDYSVARGTRSIYSVSVPQYSLSTSRSGRQEWSHTEARNWSTRGYALRGGLLPRSRASSGAR
jgi:hypothetical protein